MAEYHMPPPRSTSGRQSGNPSTQHSLPWRQTTTRGLALPSKAQVLWLNRVLLPCPNCGHALCGCPCPQSAPKSLLGILRKNAVLQRADVMHDCPEGHLTHGIQEIHDDTKLREQGVIDC